MLNEVVRGILDAMGQENVSKITIGMGANDISHLLNSKIYTRVKGKVGDLTDDGIKDLLIKHFAYITLNNELEKVDISLFNNYINHYLTNLLPCDKEALEAGCPIDYITEEIKSDGDDFIKEVYSDCTLDVGQVLLWENPLYKKIEDDQKQAIKQKEIEVN